MQTRFGKAASDAAVNHVPLRFRADNLFGVSTSVVRLSDCVFSLRISRCNSLS